MTSVFATDQTVVPQVLRSDSTPARAAANSTDERTSLFESLLNAGSADHADQAPQFDAAPRTADGPQPANTGERANNNDRTSAEARGPRDPGPAKNSADRERAAPRDNKDTNPAPTQAGGASRTTRQGAPDRSQAGNPTQTPIGDQAGTTDPTVVAVDAVASAKADATLPADGTQPDKTKSTDKATADQAVAVAIDPNAVQATTPAASPIAVAVPVPLQPAQPVPGPSAQDATASAAATAQAATGPGAAAGAPGNGAPADTTTAPATASLPTGSQPQGGPLAGATAAAAQPGIPLPAGTNAEPGSDKKVAQPARTKAAEAAQAAADPTATPAQAGIAPAGDPAPGAKPPATTAAERTASAAQSDPGDVRPETPRPDSSQNPANSAATQNINFAVPAASLPTPTMWPAAAAAATAATDHAVPIAGLAVEIVARARDGEKHFEIRLDPPELGRIDVRLSMDGHGRVTSHLAADRPETLDLLRRDASSLERALQSAGLKTDDGGMQFSLRDQSMAGGNHTPRDGSQTVTRLVVADPELPPVDTALRGYGRLGGRGSGVDIRV